MDQDTLEFMHDFTALFNHARGVVEQTGEEVRC
jgi:hypothetical protein